MQRIGLAVVRALSVVLAPLADEAQQPGKVYRIGVLTTSSGRPLVNEPSSPYRAFLQALRELGYTEGQNVVRPWRTWTGIESDSWETEGPGL